MASSLLTTPLRVGKSLTDKLLDIDVPVEQTVTTVKSIGRGSEKKIVPDDPKKNIFRLKEEIEEPLNPSLKRAMGKAKADPELEGARDIMPAPAKFFTPESKSYKEPLAKGLEESGVELDLEFGNYVQFGGGPPKDVSGKTFNNLFISPRLSYKKSTEKSLRQDKETGEIKKGSVQNKAQSTGNIYEGKALTDDDLRQNYKANTGEKKSLPKLQINLLQPERFKIRVGKSLGTLDHPIVAVERASTNEHFYSFDMQVVGPVIMQKIKKDVQPNLRPSTIGKINFGDVVGEIEIPTKDGSKKHPIYNKIEIDSTDSMPQDMQPVPKFNQGGTAMKDQMQMAFMNEGGMKDDGGKTEPTSGNKVPSGSLKEEVADDIPAMLSEGEFVFPADVVRYIGLETLMKMRQDAKQGLKMMEKMGQLGNPEEAELPDDIPFGMADLVVISGEMEDKEKKAEGGAVGLANGGGLFDDPRFQTGDTGQDPTVYTPEEEQEIKGALDEPMQPSDIQIKKIINPSNPDDFMMWSFDKEGNPLYPLPEGYVVDDTPVEDSYSNIISRREQPTESDSGDSGQMVDPRDSAGMTLPKADEFIDSDQYIDADGKKEYGLFSRGRPIRLQKTTLDNLTMEYNKLKQIQPNLTFEQYYNLPTYDKVRFSLRSSLGRDPDRKEIDAAIRQAQQSPTGLISFLNPVVGAIKSFLSPDASGGFTDKEYEEQRDKRDKAVRKLTNLIDPRTSSPYKTDEEGKISDAEYQKYKADIALESQAKFPSTGKVGKVDDFLLGIRRDPNKPDEPPKIMTPQGEQDLTPDALGRIEKNRQEQQNINQRLDAADRDRQERGFGPMSVQEREEKRQEEFTGFTSSGDFIGPTDPGTAAMNRFYVGGVPTKPMKPQRLKKGGIASPKAKPKKMKKGGLASLRKK
mgnify:CR=1 FL=1|tara:strand:- start:128 stop:2866 length:2739 start_codon:yes stop_codon:yes gene_type:complete